MSYVDWMIRTKQLGTCSCDYGCPCEFNAPPTRVPCEGVMAMEITEGYFGDVRLDGLRTAGVYHWPGPVHDGGPWAFPNPGASSRGPGKGHPRAWQRPLHAPAGPPRIGLSSPSGDPPKFPEKTAVDWLTTLAEATY